MVGRLRGIETVLLDLDGTLYVGSQAVPGAFEAVRWLRDQGLTVRFCTNTDSVTLTGLADRLAERGFEAAEDEPVTPVAVAARLFASAPEARVLAVAADGVRELLGRSLAGPGEPASHVLVADPSYGATYDDLDAAFRAWGRRGAGRHPGPTRLGPRRRRAPGYRRWCGCWSTPPAGPPGCCRRSSSPPWTPLAGADTALVVGDDLAADVGGGRAVGAATVLVRSGKGDRPQPGADAEPDAVVDSVADLPGLLGG